MGCVASARFEGSFLSSLLSKPTALLDCVRIRSQIMGMIYRRVVVLALFSEYCACIAIRGKRLNKTLTMVLGSPQKRVLKSLVEVILLLKLSQTS